MKQVDDRVCEGGQEVEISLSRMKEELLEQLGSTQVRLTRKKGKCSHVHECGSSVGRDPRAQIMGANPTGVRKQLS